MQRDLLAIEYQGGVQMNEEDFDREEDKESSDFYQ